MSNQIVITSGAKLRDLDDVIVGTDGILSSVAFNVANGVPRLDENGKILVSQLPNSVMEFKGVWNAATNTPTLANGTGNAGDVWLCNVAGTVNFGAGPIAFAVGDYAVYTGTVWARSSGATGTVTSVGVSRDGNALAITGSPVTTSGTINLGFSGDNTQYINGAGNLTTFPTLITSIGLTMPAAFNVSNSPLTANGTIGVSAAGYASQYIRGDGTLADFPTSGGGGSSVSYYFNGGTSQGTIGGTTYYEMSKTADTGTGVDFNKTGDGFIVAFLTDANDPNLLQIPAGNWEFEIYASMSANGGTPELYAELYIYDGTTFTLIATSSHEILYDGVNLNLYSFATAVPQTSLTVTDRLAIKLYADNSGGKTTTIHTQDSHLCQVITTFSTGLTALNGLTAQVQYFGTGTSGNDFNIVSSVATHTFNIPSASATARGLITTGTQTIAGAKTFEGQLKSDSLFLIKESVIISAVTGYTSISTTPTSFAFYNGANTSSATFYYTGSAYRAYTLPSSNGTLALTSDISYPVTSVFGRTGAVVATEGDYTLTQLGDVTITSPTSGQVLKYNGTAWINDTDANTGTVTSVAMTVPTGLSIAGSPITSSGTLAVTFAAGYSIPTNASQTTWDTAYTNRITSLTVTGSSGASTLISNVLNIPTYTLSGLGGQPLATNLTSLAGLTYASTSFVKMTATGTFSLDTNTYALASALGDYLPLSGGALTGAITITSSTTGLLATFTSNQNEAQIRFINTSTSGRTYSIGSGGASSGGINGFYIYDETSFAIRFGISSNGNAVLGGTSAISGGSAAQWLTVDGATSTYGGGFISAISGTPKALYYFDGAYAVVQGGTNIGAALQYNNGTNALTVNGTSGIVTIYAINGALNLTGATTTAAYINIANTSGQLLIGVTSSTGGFWTAGAANNYASTIGTNTNTDLTFATNNTIRVTIANSGAVTFTSNITAASFIKNGGTSSQFLKADGSVDISTYLTTTSAASTYVPYTGATTDVNLGTRALSAGNILGTKLSASQTSNTEPSLVVSNAGTFRIADFNNSGALVAYITNSGSIYGSSFVKSGGSSSQFLKADGSVDSTSYQSAITLTTTGTSGAATFVSNTLNIPNYSGSYLPLSGGTLTGNLYIQSSGNPSQLLLKGTNSEFWVDSTYGGGTARAFVNRGTTGNQATLMFSTGVAITNGTAWGGSCDYSMGTTNDSSGNFYIGSGDLYSSGNRALTINSSKYVGINTNNPTVLLQISNLQSGTNGSINGASGTINRAVINCPYPGAAALTLGYYSLAYGIDIWVNGDGTGLAPIYFDQKQNESISFRRGTYSTAYETLRITGAGYTKATMNGSFYSSGSGTFHEFVQSTSNQDSMWIYNTATSGYGLTINMPNTPVTGGTYFLRCLNSTTTYYLYANGTTTFTSDKNLKKNIETTRNGYLEDIMNLRVVKYNWNIQEDKDPKELGLIAQEVAEIFPSLIVDQTIPKTREITKQDGTIVKEEYEVTQKGLKTSVIPFILLKALQEANIKIQELNNRLNKLENN